jgi:hypothetical protein
MPINSLQEKKYRAIEEVPEKTIDAYKNALRNIIRSTGFKVTTVSCDYKDVFLDQ